MTVHYRDADGVYLGGFDGASPPTGAIQCPAPPHANANWNGTGWDAYVPVPAIVRKLALVRACRDTPWLGSDLWTLAKGVLEDPATDSQMKEDWDLAMEIPRNDTDFIALATALGATSENIDAVFRLAATLE